MHFYKQNSVINVKIVRCETDKEPDTNSTPEADRVVPNMPEEGEGWMSWAWNSVIGEYDEETGPVDGETSTSIPKSSVILSIGVYLKTGSILMKCGRRPARTLFGIYFDGTGVEIVNQGDSFFSAVFGMTSLTIRYFGSLPSYMNPVGGEGCGSIF